MPTVEWDPEAYRMLGFTGSNQFGGWVDLDGKPRRLLVRSKHKKMPDLFTPGWWIVSDRLKSLIEEFEPDVHLFIPIPVIFKDGTPANEKMYVCDICRHLDAIIVEESELRWDVGDGTGTPRLTYRTLGWPPCNLVFDKTKIGNSHLWRNGTYLQYELFISDLLATEIKKKKLINILLYRQEER